MQNMHGHQGICDTTPAVNGGHIRLPQLDLDAVCQYRDVVYLVGLVANSQLVDREGAKHLALQQFLRNQAADLLQRDTFSTPAPNTTSVPCVV